MKQWSIFVVIAVSFVTAMSIHAQQTNPADSEPAMDSAEEPNSQSIDSVTADTETADTETADSTTHNTSAPQSETVETGSKETETATPEVVSEETAPENMRQPQQYNPEPADLSPHSVRRLMFLMGPGISFGFFFPQEINDYLEAWAEDYVDVEEGFSGMVLNFVPRVSFCFAPIEYVQISALGEIGWSPKAFAVIGGDNESFHFLRFTTGGTVDGHIPIKNRFSLFFGGGVFFNYLRFGDWEAITPGYRGEAGFRWYSRRGKAFTPELLVTFDYIRKTASGTPKMELDYTGVTVGANFHFTLTSH